jgi:hypothetical protein
MLDKRSLRNSIINKITNIIKTFTNKQTKIRYPQSMNYYLGCKQRKLDWGHVERILNLVGNLEQDQNVGELNAFILQEVNVNENPNTKDLLIEEIRLMIGSLV